MSWTIDTSHSDINFTVRHMMISNVRGRFERFAGEVNFNEQEPEKTSVDVKVETASINTRDEQRDNHLRSPDFFNSEKYPYMTFKSQRVEAIENRRARLYGDLTIKDITRPVVFDVEYSGMATSPWGKQSAGFSASTTINRKDWDLTWNQPLETGGVLVGEDIKVNLELELIKQSEAELETSAVGG